MKEIIKIRIKDDLIDDETGKFLFGKGDIVNCDMTLKDKSGINYVVNGYVLPEDVVEVLDNGR